MKTIIPPRLEKPEPKERRFYVVADSSVHLALQQEAHSRGTDLWTLGGSVLTAWLNAGCPSIFDPIPQSPFPEPEHEGVSFSASGTRSYEGSLPERAETFVSVHAVNRARAEGHPDNFEELESEEKEKILYCHECRYIFDSYGPGWRRCPECDSPVCDHRIGQCQCLGNY